MDHRLIEIDGQDTILLDRLEEDSTAETPWQVLISTFTDIDHRYDEWINFENPQLARGYIVDYSESSAREFVERAKAWHESRYAKKTALSQ